jgi:hypothetical protein
MRVEMKVDTTVETMVQHLAELTAAEWDYDMAAMKESKLVEN